MSDQRIARAKELRATGLQYTVVAAELGVSKATAYRWVNDAYAERQRKRSLAWKRENAGTCEHCGSPTNASRGKGKAARVCADCLQWTPEAVILALQEWAAEHGCSPTRAVAGLPSSPLPTPGSADRLFGSWNEALTAAGLPINRDRTLERSAEMAALADQGLTLGEIGELYGCSPSNVSQRIQRFREKVAA